MSEINQLKEEVRNSINDLKTDLKENVKEIKNDFQSVLEMINKNHNESLDRFSKELIKTNQNTTNLTALVNTITSKHNTCSTLTKEKHKKLQEDVNTLKIKSDKLESDLYKAIFKAIMIVGGVATFIISVLIGSVGYGIREFITLIIKNGGLH